MLPHNKLKQFSKKIQTSQTKASKKNRTGLHQLTSDALGNQNQYELTIKNPEQTRNHELYLKLEGITVTPLDAAQTAANKANRAVLANRALVPLNQLTAIRNNLTSYDNGSFVITASAHGMSNAVTQLGKDELSNYLPKHQALLNLGYSAKSRKTITIKFDGPAAINIKKNTAHRGSVQAKLSPSNQTVTAGKATSTPPPKKYGYWNQS